MPAVLTAQQWYAATHRAPSCPLAQSPDCVLLCAAFFALGIVVGIWMRQ